MQSRGEGVKMAENLIVEECVFYVHDGRVAIELPGVSRTFERAVYDGKNTLQLFEADGSVCVAENIVPEVRDVLGKTAGVLIVNRDEAGDVAGGYLVKLAADGSLGFDDRFAEEAGKCYEEVARRFVS